MGSEFGEQLSEGEQAAYDDTGSTEGCGAGDLRPLLTSILEQIAEADRRHGDTLRQVQDRIASLGRDAQAIKPRVPDRYAAAFERIEAGMSELASRITEAAHARDYDHAASAQSGHDPMPSAEFPIEAALVFGNAKSFEEGPAPLRAPGEAPAPRYFAGVDTFDIIESDPPGNSDPWDRDAAEALTSAYETSSAGFSSGAYSANPQQFVTQQFTSFSSFPSPAFDAPPGDVAAEMADRPWLEARFDEIAKRLEESLSTARSDEGFFALSQRVDQFEQHLSAAMEGIATRGDVEGIQLIEAHVGDIANHLEIAHNQLMRLDEIEHHLARFAEKLDDVHHAATMSLESAPVEPAPPQPAVDLESIARVAARAAAAEFSKIQPAPAEAVDTAELAATLRSFITECRQGDENTSALLDTMQQAMIRLLDRVDSMEMSALQNAHRVAPAPQTDVLARTRYEDPDTGHHDPADGFRDHPMPADTAATVAGEPALGAAAPAGREESSKDEDRTSAHSAPEQPDDFAASSPSPESIRQGFIAEVRSAKMRLSAEAETAGQAETADAPEAQPPSREARAPTSVAALRARSQTSTASQPDEKAKAKPGASGSSRLRVFLLATLLALGGFWATTQSNLLADEGPLTAPAPGPAATPAKPTATQSSSAGAGATDLKLPEGTRGEIIPGEIEVGATSVPLYGVAVDTGRPITAEGLERARRQQAMAAVSTQLGEAAARNGAAIAVPAALQPEPPMPEAPRSETGAMARSSALDLPPATVGPLSLRLAAAKGDPSAEFEVGARLAEGKGTDQTFEEAAKWYHRAASKGLAQAQYRLATLYERGLGVQQDKARAEDWYRRAADQGHIKAMHNLAVLRANATSGSPDYMNAALWFEKAAELGLPDSQFNLAVLKENGLGVPKDMVSAYKWLSLASRNGDREAIRRRDVLKGKLTTAELAEAENRIAAFRAKRPDPSVNDAFKAGEAWKKNS